MQGLSKHEKIERQIKIRLGRTLYRQFPKNPKFKAYLIIHNIGEEVYEKMEARIRFKALFDVFYKMKLSETHPMFGKGYDVCFYRIIDWKMFVEVFKKSCEDCGLLTRQNFSFDQMKAFIEWVCNPKFVFPSNVTINDSEMKEAPPVPKEIFDELSQYIEESKKTARIEECKYRAKKMAEYKQKGREALISHT